MEAWKFFDYSSVSPVWALGFTAERWGLEPFPGNLIASTEYWQDIEGTDNNRSASILPYGCPSSKQSEFPDYSWYDLSESGPVFRSSNDSSLFNGSEICSSPQPCPDSGCFILIEGIRATTTGPANSDIVGLAHGISFLIITIIFTAISITIAMGGCLSGFFNPVPPAPLSAVQLAPQLRQYMNPPAQAPQRAQTYVERKEVDRNTAQEVARCSNLLRQMYALDLAIWGMEESVEDEVDERQELMYKANALFAEIQGVVHGWMGMVDEKWSPEERTQIEEICRLLGQHDEWRYYMTPDGQAVFGRHNTGS